MKDKLWFARNEQRLADVDATLERYKTDAGDIAPVPHSASAAEIEQQLRVMQEARRAYLRLREDNINGMHDLVDKARSAADGLPAARAQEIRSHIANSEAVMRAERRKLNSTIRELERHIRQAENLLAEVEEWEDRIQEA